MTAPKPSQPGMQNIPDTPASTVPTTPKPSKPDALTPNSPMPNAPSSAMSATADAYASTLSPTSPATNIDLPDLTYNEAGLIPCIVQDNETGEILMLAWMNKESLTLTLKTEQMTFWSRSRQELWRKGATSGNIQQLIEMAYDCDADTLLAKVKAAGPACHTGATSCFFNRIY